MKRVIKLSISCFERACKVGGPYVDLLSGSSRMSADIDVLNADWQYYIVLNCYSNNLNVTYWEMVKCEAALGIVTVD